MAPNIASRDRPGKAAGALQFTEGWWYKKPVGRIEQPMTMLRTIPTTLPLPLHRLPGGLRLWCRDEHLEALRNLFPETAEPYLTAPEAALVKHTRSRFVVRFSLTDTHGTPLKVYGKRYLNLRWRSRLTDLLTGSRAWREARSIRAAVEAGIPTPGVIAIAERRTGLRVRASYLVTLDAGPNRSLKALVRAWRGSPPPGAERRTLLRRVARSLARWQGLGMDHNDLSADHILVPDRQQDPIAVIDLDHCRLGSGRRPDHHAYALGHVVRSVYRDIRPVDALVFLGAFLEATGAGLDRWKTWWRHVDTMARIRNNTKPGLKRQVWMAWTRVRYRVS